MLCSKLYREEYANIVLFLTHHSKDLFIISQLLQNAKIIFKECSPLKLEGDIEGVNKLISELPKVILRDVDVKKNREEVLKRQDEMEQLSNKNSKEKEQEDTGEVSELDIPRKLNLAFKTIEIIGQVLKNYYGSLKGAAKYDIAEEAYMVTLRSLKCFFEALEKNTENMINDVKAIIEKRGIVAKDKIEEVARNIVFYLIEIITFAFIKKTGGAIGSEKIRETISEIVERNAFNSVYLIDMSIKLDFYRGFPYEDIERLKNRFKSTPLPQFLLRRLVLYYLYMFPTGYKEKQKICNILGISMGNQRKIDEISTQRKREL